MKEFNGRGGLARLESHARLVYTGFLALLLLGLVSTALLHADSMGLTGAATWWRGDETGMAYPKSYRQLLELTHFHLFTEPLVWLVVAHLYQLAGGRVWVSFTTLLAIAIQIALPWIVVYATSAVAPLFAPATLVVAGGLLWMIGVSMKVLVLPRSS